MKLRRPKIEVDEEVEIREEISKKNHICAECGKGFSSGKALGGHMSSAHVQPNNRALAFKKYGQSSKRGMMKPPKKEIKNEDDDINYYFEKARNIVVVAPLVTTLNDCLKSWAVTGRRGRCANISKRKVVVMKPTIDEENTREICYSTDSKFKNSVVNKKRKVDCQKDKDVSPIKKRYYFLSAVTSEKYKCNICDKSFTSHQALGGHRSSHTKFKITITTKVAPSTGGEKIAHVHQLGEKINCSIEQFGSNKRGGSKNIHKFKVCDKSFPTGRALGHQRCHWNNQDESSQNVSKVLDFDLNELPPQKIALR